MLEIAYNQEAITTGKMIKLSNLFYQNVLRVPRVNPLNR